VRVQDGQRIAKSTAAQPELSLEVGRPNAVRLIGVSPGRLPCTGEPPSTTTWLREAFALHNRTDRTACWPARVRLRSIEPRTELARSPRRMLLSKRDDLGHDLRGRLCSLAAWSSRAIDQAAQPFPLIALSHLYPTRRLTP